ncbi:autophagy-related protein 2 homolog B-like [Rhopilema esculentum]|uniref:autophagy-related protein 2 homolog B-like n=1 Tax=Rhopilema esculentum TaxID=499914 RepID=UPI0031D3CBED
MPWYFPWSESIKKRACRYLLQHYLGDFLKEKLTLEQLTVDLYNGKGTVSDVLLDVWALNEVLESVGIPLEIIDGFISSISVAVPWTSLLSESCHIDLNGLELTLAPKQRFDPFNHGNMFDSTMSWSSMNMTTSMQLAQQCLKQDATAGEEQAESAQMFEGLEAFAQTIESVLSRIKLSFTNTIIRLENILPDCVHGVGLELHIDRIDYLDLSHDEINEELSPDHAVYEPVAIAIKSFQIYGLKLYMDEFPFEKRTRLREADEREGQEYDEHLHLGEELARMPGHNNQKDNLNLMPQVQILASHGKQSVRVKIKHNDTLPGPKVDLEYSLGALNILLSPKQLHLLIDMATAISMSSTLSQTKEGQKKNSMRPMNTDDYRRVEQALQQQITAPSGKRKFDKKPDSWHNALESLNSTHSLNSSEGQDEEFYSMSDYSSLPPLGQPPGFPGYSPEKSLTNVSLGGNGSLVSAVNSPPKGSLTEQATNVFRASTSSPPSVSQASRAPHILKGPRVNQNAGLVGISSLDDTSDLTNLKLRSSNIIIILLHQDPIDTCKKLVKENSAEHSLLELSEDFFEGIAPFSIQNLFSEAGEDARKELASLCAYDHVRILMSAVTTSCECRTVSGNRSLGVDLVIGKLMVEENLYDKTRKKSSSLPCSQTKLLYFPTDQAMSVYPTGFGAAPSPCVKVRMQKTERGKPSLTAVQSRTSIVPKSLVNIQLSKVEIDVDVSIVDRIAAIMYPPPLLHRSENRSNTTMYSSFLSGNLLNRQTAFNQAMEDSPVHLDSKTDISVTCNEMSIILRFPVPDLRPASDIDKHQWWQRSIRKEYITTSLQNVEFKTVFSQSQASNFYELRFRNGEGYFHQTDEDLLQFFKVSCAKNEEDVEDMHLDWPRIVVYKQPQTTRSVFDDAESEANASPDSQFGSLEDSFPWIKTDPSPFSANPAMFEKEELVMPGSIPEMNSFQDIASSSSKFFVSLSFPDLQLNLHEKSVFELIYNRLFNDLLMWEPSVPSPLETMPPLVYPQIQNNIHVNLASQVGISMNQKFFMCRSAIKDGYDSDSDQDNSLASTIGDGMTTENQQALLNQQSNIAVSVHIDRGKVAFFPKTQGHEEENSTENEIDADFGHVVIDVEDLNFFTVVSYRGDVNLDYAHLYSGDATLYHSGQVDCEIDRFRMDDAFFCGNLNRTLYRSDESVLAQSREAQDVSSESVSALSLAIKTTHMPSKNRKHVLVALGLRGSTLRHLVTEPEKTWLSQIMDFMTVDDQTILGYTFPSVITTLYLQLWGCSIDYRPKNLSLRSLLTIETFSLSSNISPGSLESVLRFIVDDSALYLSDKQFGHIDLNKDYVCVMDMELFELVLRLSESEDKKRPKMEMSMSNNVLNIHTCSDSCAALVNLIKYVAADGDICTGSMESLVEPNSQNESTENLYSRSSVDENTIDSLMADALIEEETPKENETQNTKIFTDRHGFTSSELFSSSATSNSSSTRSLNEQLGDACDDDYDDRSSSGDEYCILEQDDENDDNSDFEPVTRKLIAPDVHILDNFFQVPRGRYDLLGAPTGYPSPVYRYTIREMSVVWKMYGGRDFQVPEYNSPSPLESGSPTLNSYSPRQSPVHRQGQNKKPQRLSKKYEDKNFAVSENERRKGKYKGGLGRDYNTLVELHLNKIRFQHEIYPDDEEKISRDVLLIYDVEITDRLASSQINKFLYRFSSEALPIKTSAHMITVKLLLTKPEDDVKNKEGTLRISLQPIRLNVDQDALFFMKNFFTEISGENQVKHSSSAPDVRALKREGVRFSSSPSCGTTAESLAEELNISEEHFAASAPLYCSQSRENLSADDSPVFFRSVVFSPEVPIRLDYHGKSVNMGQGTLAGLLIGLAQLNCSELKLKRLCCRSGLLGTDKILNYVLNEWLTDIRRNQIPGILGGVGPTYSFVQLYQGIKDLFWLPVQQYRQDGRLVRGLQKGAHSFSTSTAMAVLEITNRIVQTVQVAAETAYDMVSPGPSPEGGASKRQSAKSKSEQPVDLREGVTNAYNVLSEGITQTATTIVRVAVEEHERKGVTGAVGGVLRQIPPSIMQPFILATEATSNVLGGARNQLSPDARIEAAKKWKATQKSQK